MAAVSPDVPERLRRISVEEYHRMIEARILGEDEDVQLIDGLLVEMTPQGRPHAFAIQELSRLLVRALGDEYRVLTQLPLALENDSEPEPDLAVVRTGDAASSTRHPGTALLVVEVSGESLRFDRRTKAALYARNAIPEYWIVNLTEGVIEVHRDPDAASGAYRQTRAYRRGDTLMAPFGEGVPVAVADVIP